MAKLRQQIGIPLIFALIIITIMVFAITEPVINEKKIREECYKHNKVVISDSDKYYIYEDNEMKIRYRIVTCANFNLQNETLNEQRYVMIEKYKQKRDEQEWK